MAAAGAVTYGGAADDATVEAVLDAARAGAPWALRRLYDAYAPAVLGYARSHGASAPDEVVNDTLYRAFRRLDAFSGGAAALRSWIFTIAHNLIVDDHRRRSRRVQQVHEAAGSDALHPAPSAEDEAVTNASHRDVLALLAALPPDQRAVLALRVVADLPITQIAAVVGKSPGAVKALQRRGLQNLRRRIEQGVPL